MCPIDVIKLNTGNMLCICADENEYRLYHYFSSQPIITKGADSLIVKADTMLNNIYFPQASTEIRSFTGKKKTFANKEDRSVEVKENTEIHNKGERGTFLVQVQYRQNSTWQGKVTWTDKSKSTHFRSALELLKLIDSALNKEDSNDDNIKFE